MARRDDSYIAAFQTADEDSKSYAVQCASGTMAYLDAPSGYYDCFAPAGVSGEHFRWTYISVGATLAPSSLPAPTAATSAQTPLVGGMAPANASASTRNDVNNMGGSVGLLVQAPSDAGADKIPQGDVDTAVKFGERVAAVAAKTRG